MSRLGKRIKQARVDNHMAQIDVAIKAQISPFRISQLERGHVPAKVLWLEDIARAIRVPVAELRNLHEVDKCEQLLEITVEVRRTPEMEHAILVWKGQA